MRGLGFWLVTTEHLKNGLLFKDDEDYKCGMNCVAVSSVATGVNVLAFILMSNHTHFVLECEQSAVNEFISKLKKNYSRYYCKKYSEQNILKRNEVYIQQLSQSNEALERAIAYVQMNSVAANICVEAMQYPWGTGGTFFTSTKVKGTYLKDISARSRNRILHSNVDMPPYLILSDEGYIVPETYVRKDLVEDVFKTAKRMKFFLNKSSKARRNLEYIGGAPNFNDTLVAQAVTELCNSMFHKKKLADLTQTQTIELLRQLQYRFSASIDQIARVTGLEYPEVSRWLDGV